MTLLRSLTYLNVIFLLHIEFINHLFVLVKILVASLKPFYYLQNVLSVQRLLSFALLVAPTFVSSKVMILVIHQFQHLAFELGLFLSQFLLLMYFFVISFLFFLLFQLHFLLNAFPLRLLPTQFN